MSETKTCEEILAYLSEQLPSLRMRGLSAGLRKLQTAAKLLDYFLAEDDSILEEPAELDGSGIYFRHANGTIDKAPFLLFESPLSERSKIKRPRGWCPLNRV